MNKKGELSDVGTLIMAAVAVIFCTVIIIEVSHQETTATDKLFAFNESDVLTNCWQQFQGGGAWQVNQSRPACNITVDRNTSGEWQYSGCPLTSVVVRNTTNATAVSGTDYVVFNGVIALQNTTFWYNNSQNNSGNLTYADYNFCPIGYNNDAGARGIAGTWTLLLSLALAFVVLSAIGVKKGWFDF